MFMAAPRGVEKTERRVLRWIRQEDKKAMEIMQIL